MAGCCGDGGEVAGKGEGNEMIEIRCDICRKTLPDAQAGPVAFCERHLPFAEEFLTEANKIAEECRLESRKRIERLRNQFNQRTSLKAVSGERASAL